MPPAAGCRRARYHQGPTSPNVAGHSSSDSMTLQLALNAPGAVHTLTLVEAVAHRYPAAVRQRHHPGRCPAPADSPPGRGGRSLSSAGVFGSGYRSARDDALPGGFEQATADAGGCSSPATRYPSSLTGCLAQRQNHRSAQRSRSRRYEPPAAPNGGSVASKCLTRTGGRRRRCHMERVAGSRQSAPVIPNLGAGVFGQELPSG
jgi:pimeloyl-ACP methyl ester carboxylesterase